MSTAPPAQEDAALLAAMVAGDTAAFRKLFRRYFKPVVGLAYGVLLDSAEAEDVAQDVFARLHREVMLLRPDTNVRSWLFKVALNQALGLRRRLRTWRRRWMSPEQPFSDSERTAAVRDAVCALVPALNALPERQRAVLMLTVQGFTPTEAARILGATPGATRVMLHRALARMRQHSQELGIEFPAAEPLVSLEEEFT